MSMDKATQARRFDVAAVLLRTNRAGAIAHIRALAPFALWHLQSLADWVIDYEEGEWIYG